MGVREEDNEVKCKLYWVLHELKAKAELTLRDEHENFKLDSILQAK
jgi:hypothetical protein